jgi:acyl-homoserine-lactone acylase
MSRIAQIIFSQSLAFCGLIIFCQLVLAQTPSRFEANPEKMAREVTIYRDVYGVPHVFGRTDASTVFGFAYAQAEDNFWRLEDNYISAIGRDSEVHGEATVNKDRLNHALEIPRLAREE